MPTPALTAASLARFFSSSVISSTRRTAGLDGEHLFHDEPLRDHRLEFIEHHIDRVNLFALVALDHVPSKSRSLCEFHLSENAHVFAGDLCGSSALGFFWFGLKRLRKLREAPRLHLRCRIAPAKKVSSLAADGFDVDILARLGLKKSAGGFRNVSVESARQPLISGHNDQ